MDINTLKLVALQEMKQIRRNWLFIFFVFLVMTGILCLQIVMQTSSVAYNLRALPCSIPYLNALLYNFLQCLFVIFATGDFVHREVRKDTIAAIQTRAYENKEYLFGKVIGIVFSFFCLNIIAAFAAFVFQMITKQISFTFFPYIFYLFTLTFPTLLFITGLSLLVHSVVRSMFLAITCLLGYCILDIWFLTGIFQGTFDMFALKIPNVFSQVTGHVGMYPYLLQRLAFVLAGIALALFAVVYMKRIPGNIRALRQAVLSGCFILLLGCVSGVLYYNDYLQDQRIRREYMELYEKTQDKYVGVNIVSQRIEYRQEGGRMKVRDSLLVENSGEDRIKEFILYLNPGLIITGLTWENRDIPYQREGQACRVELPVGKGEKICLAMEYEGKIDEKICYLDIDNDVYYNAFWGNSLMGYGRHNALLEKDFTLLTPECLWYPVSFPPVFPGKSNMANRMFTDYRLTVITAPGYTAISQGEVFRKGDSILFENDHALSGLSLCMGKYKNRTIALDSMDLDVYYFDEQSMLLRECDGDANAVSKGIQAAWDYNVSAQLIKYPFRRMKIIEVPVAFCSYLREWKEGSEFVQPGIIFRPENQCDKVFVSPLKEYVATIKKWDKEHTEAEITENQLAMTWAMDFGPRTNNMPLHVVIKSLFSKVSVIEDKRNLFAIEPMFADFTGVITSDKYPRVDRVIQSVFEVEPFELQMEYYGQELEKERKAERLLTCNSLRDILETGNDMSMLDPVLQVKGRYLKKKLYSVVSSDDFQKFMEGFKLEHMFEHIPFSCFAEEMKVKLGVDLEDMIWDLYDSRGIPWFYVKDIQQHKIEEGYVLSFDIWNSSRNEGVISLYTAMKKDYMQFREFKSITVEAGTCKHWEVILPGWVDAAGISTNMAMNLPNMYLQYFKEEPEEAEIMMGDRMLDSVPFLPLAGEIIVDDEDAGFRTIETKSRGLLKRDTGKDREYLHMVYMSMEDFPEWKSSVSPEAYGNPYRSYHFKKVGKEKSYVEWNTCLPEAGDYEIFIHHLSLNLRLPFNQELFSSYYTVEQGDYKADVRIDFNSLGDRKVIMTDNSGRENESVFGTENRNSSMWVPVGVFTFNAGETKITLSNQGAFPGQVIFADAVKWVKK